LILATGYCFKLPDFLAPIEPQLSLDRHGHLNLGDNFSVKWDGPRGNKIFAVNAGRHSYGIAEPQLSLMAWRSAMIVNAILGRSHFDIDMMTLVIKWSLNDGGFATQIDTDMPIPEHNNVGALCRAAE